MSELSPCSSEVLERERAFHDAWADSESNVNHLREYFEGPAALENQEFLRVAGPLSGKRVLDLGCGLGEASVYFALQNAETVSADISPRMLQHVSNLAFQHGVSVEPILLDGKRIPLPDASIDIVYCANIVHHVQERAALYQEIKRVLKKGGLAFFWEPLGYNPVISIYRRLARDMRTIDERPLLQSDLNEIESVFGDTTRKHWWFLANAVFVKYFLVDRLHPGKVRYWKLIYNQDSFSTWWWRPLEVVDRWILRLPGVKLLSWNVTIWVRVK